MTDLLDTNDTHATVQLVTFHLGPEEYAVGVEQVQEIVRYSTITPVPRAPAFVEGVFNLRGRIVPVVDLAKRLGLRVREGAGPSRIIVTQIAGRTVGMAVDAVDEVLLLREDAVEPASAVLKDGGNAEFFVGIGKLGERLLLMLDLPKVLAPHEEASLAAMDDAPEAP